MYYIIGVTIVSILGVLLAAALDRRAERRGRLPRAVPGDDADRDADRVRVQHDLDALRDRRAA